MYLNIQSQMKQTEITELLELAFNTRSVKKQNEGANRKQIAQWEI